MNLKEAFRYQNFFEMLMQDARISITEDEHCLNVKKTHFCNKVDPKVENIEETVVNEPFFANTDVISFMEWLIVERDKLTQAIGAAKASVAFDIDAAVATNKFRHDVSSSIKSMLRITSYKSVEQGCGYKFNVEGNQMPYVYEIEVVKTEAYDRESAKKIMRSIISESDRVSSEIDSAMINTVVKYEPTFDVNESFDDVMSDFLERK